jgi:serine/threonine protein kinase/WD40 repeat protein
MATNDSGSAGASGDQRQVSSANGGGSQVGAGAESQRGVETVSGAGAESALPERFGPYRVQKKLGGGGMGTVYLVENTQLQREEALKVPHFGGDDAARQRFLQEAQAAAKLDSHPNLCPVYHVGVEDGVYFLTMRYLKGRLLSEYTGKPQPPRKAVEIATKLAQALTFAHSKHVIHRDLKPNNIMMVGGIGPVVMDFGLAKQIRQQDQKLTQAGTMLGTPAYMPPEQIRGELEQMGPASDIYSLGVILYELLTGRLPFEGAMAEVFGKVLYTEAPLPSSLQPGLGPMLDIICGKAMAKAPQDRYSSMKAFAGALIEYLRSTPVTEGGGNLAPLKASPADVFQAATVPPSKAPPAPPSPAARNLPVATPVEVPPAGANQPIPEVTLVAPADKKKAGGPSLLLIGCAVAAVLLLVLGGLGGVAALVYSLGGSTSDTKVGSAKAAPSVPAALKDPVLGTGPAAPVSMTGHNENGVCGSLLFTPDGKQALSECYGSIYVWDLQLHRRADVWEWGAATKGSAGIITFAPDGGLLAAVPVPSLAGGGLPGGKKGHALVLFDWKDPKTHKAIDPPLPLDTGTTAVSFSPESSLLAVSEIEGPKGNRVRILEVATRKENKDIPSGAPLLSLAFSPNGQFLATGSGNPRSGRGETKIRLWNLADASQKREFDGHTASVTQVAFAADGKRLFSASVQDGTLRVWSNDDDKEAGKELHKIETGKAPAQMTCATFWPGGRALTGHADGSVVLWDLETGQKVEGVPLEKPDPKKTGFGRATGVTAVALSPDGHHGLAALGNSLVYLFRLPPPKRP